MTSLGLLQYSEISDNSVINSNMTEIEKKKQARHNITVKKRHDNSSVDSTNNNLNDNRLQNMLKLINNSNGYDNDSGDDSGAGLADFNPPPRAEVSLKHSTEGGRGSLTQPQVDQSTPNVTIDYEKPSIITDQSFNINSPEHSIASEVKPRKYPTPLDSYEGFNALPKTYASDYYKQYVPYFNQSGSSDPENSINKNKMLEKLNYMIHLLEEQRDEKTGHVMEEIILYSFLGVFIIFIVDSFARVGKYTR
jgi:hypothetical protein